jgi:hypothetical protein
MTDAFSAQLPATANFINPPTLHHPAGYAHVVEVTAGRAGRHPRSGAAGVRQPPGGTAGRWGRLRAGREAHLVPGRRHSAPVVREVRDQYVNIQQPPASTAVEVRRLVRDDLLIEVEAVAVVASFQPMTATA